MPMRSTRGLPFQKINMLIYAGFFFFVMILFCFVSTRSLSIWMQDGTK